MKIRILQTMVSGIPLIVSLRPECRIPMFMWSFETSPPGDRDFRPGFRVWGFKHGLVEVLGDLWMSMSFEGLTGPRVHRGCCCGLRDLTASHRTFIPLG